MLTNNSTVMQLKYEQQNETRKDGDTTAEFCAFSLGKVDILKENIAQAIIICIDVVSVSYTHLDVYKRQEENNRSLSQKIDETNQKMEETSKKMEEKLEENNKKMGEKLEELRAVSYTHLDVYKRQI